MQTIFYNVTETATIIRFFARKCFHVKYISRQNGCLLVITDYFAPARAYKVTHALFLVLLDYNYFAVKKITSVLRLCLYAEIKMHQIKEFYGFIYTGYNYLISQKNSLDIKKNYLSIVEFSRGFIIKNFKSVSAKIFFNIYLVLLFLMR